MTRGERAAGERFDDLVDVQSHVEAYGDAVAAAAVDDATTELAAVRDVGEDEEALDEFERAVVERLASRVVEGTLPDVRATAAGGVDDAAVAETVRALFPEE